MTRLTLYLLASLTLCPGGTYEVARGPVQIEAINAYGASARPESPHYTDPMELFSQEKFRRMSLDSLEVAGSARKRYRPGG